MKRPVLEVIRFDEADIVTASGMGMNMSNFGDQEPYNGAFTFFGGSSGDVSHDAHEENIVSAFNSYFGWSWEDLGIKLYFDNGDDELSSAVYIDTDGHGDPPGNSKYNGTYTYKNGEFYMRSN